MSEEKKGRDALIIGQYRYIEGVEDKPWLTGSEKVVAKWLAKSVKNTNLFFDNAEELERFREEVSNFAVELYRKKYNKEETK